MFIWMLLIFFGTLEIHFQARRVNRPWKYTLIFNVESRDNIGNPPVVVEVKLILIRRRRHQSCAEGARSLLSEDCAHERLGGDDR